MTRIAKGLCFLSALALWPACSSTSDNGDAAAVDAAPDGPVLGLTRGMSFFKVTAVAVTNDGCLIMPNSLVTSTVASPLPVNYVESTQMLSVGTQQGAPIMASLGTGLIGVTGTLTRENDVTDGGCVWHQKDVSMFNLTGVDVFTLDVTETQSMFTAACAPDIPTGGTCTSVFKLTLSKTTAPADGGA